MVIYLTDARLTTVTSREGYVSLGVYIHFLTPAYDWIQNCIWDWNWVWDTATNTSALWLNRRQGIIAMLSGGTLGQFCEPIRAEAKRKKWRHSSGAYRRYSHV